MPTNHDERLAPVTPIFGGPAPVAQDPERPTGVDASPAGDARAAAEPGAVAEFPVPRRTGEDGVWRSTWDDGPASGRNGDAGARSPSPMHPAGSAQEPQPPRMRALRPVDESDASQANGDMSDPDALRADAEERLVRKLRTRALSVSEARSVLREQGLDSADSDMVIDDFCRRSYLDDRVLAGHLVTAGVQRKAQGRVALRRALSQRGIPRDVIDEALDELPDDDAERALEFARTKARSMARLEHETALRRLHGQLARRGFGGHVAMEAARTALSEAGTGDSAGGGVRFEPS